MLKPFSRYLKAVEEHLLSEHHNLLRNSLYLAILDWYTDGVEPREAAARIKACGHSDDLRDSRRVRNLIQDCKLEVSLESFGAEG